MFQSVLDGRGDEQWVESQKGPDGQRTWHIGGLSIRAGQMARKGASPGV